jgi:hypothetical protein
MQSMKIAPHVDAQALAFVVGTIGLLFNCCSPASGAQAVDLKLVLAMDVQAALTMRSSGWSAPAPRQRFSIPT